MPEEAAGRAGRSRPTRAEVSRCSPPPERAATRRRRTDASDRARRTHRRAAMQDAGDHRLRFGSPCEAQAERRGRDEQRRRDRPQASTRKRSLGVIHVLGLRRRGHAVPGQSGERRRRPAPAARRPGRTNSAAVEQREPHADREFEDDRPRGHENERGRPSAKRSARRADGTAKPPAPWRRRTARPRGRHGDREKRVKGHLVFERPAERVERPGKAVAEDVGRPEQIGWRRCRPAGGSGLPVAR